MKFSKLAGYLERLEAMTGRNEMTRVLAVVLKKASAGEVDKICYLLLGELVPAYRGLEFNIAEKMIIQVLTAAFKKSAGEVSKLYKSKGDLGDIAGELAAKRGAVAKRGLDVSEVYAWMLEIARESGPGSQARKIEKMVKLLSGLDPLSVRFVTRIPVGKLRLGFSDATLLDALSLMAKGDKSARPAVEAAFNVTADIGEIARRVKTGGLASLKKLEATPGIPIRPSLAERLPNIEEVFEKAGPEVGVEQKLDGFRTQIHVWRKKDRKEIRLFSRNMENTTHMFPEIVEAARRLHVESVILDGETIGYNPKTGKFASFQETVQRKRKHEVAEFAQKIPLKNFIFDVLWHDGTSLLGRSLRERREILEKILSHREKDGVLQLVPQKRTGDMRVIAGELTKSLDAGLEGLVVKKLDSPYEAGSRGFHWIKLKATSAALEGLRAAPLGRAVPGLAGRAGKGKGKGRTGMLDTIDCVVMGGYTGRGKRAKFGVGGLLLGIRGPDDRYYTISRLGTGLSDEQFYEVKKRIGKLTASEQPKEYVADKDTKPDMWVKPALMAEILADEITLSPRHTAGRKGKEGRGYSLRFPRLVRLRDDKNPEDATTVIEIANMYRNQKP